MTYLCVTCGTQFSPADHPPERCPICQDERQFVGLQGQQWTTLEKLQKSHRNTIYQEGEGIWGVLTVPQFGIGQRALQIHEFISDDLTQVPDYPGKEQRVILLDARYSFYGADLVQNDPWLREPAIRMLSHGVPADAAMMRDQFPSFHRVYADDHGEVWSVSGQPLASAPR